MNVGGRTFRGIIRKYHLKKDLCISQSLYLNCCKNFQYSYTLFDSTVLLAGKNLTKIFITQRLRFTERHNDRWAGTKRIFYWWD